MTPLSFHLLRGYVRRSVALFAFLGAAQYLLDTAFWMRGIAREAVPAALLGLWGYAAAINPQSLVWRSLPLSARDASVFRWWAISGVPGIFITVLKAIGWVDQHTWSRLPALPLPSLASLWDSLLVAWAAVGVIGALSAAALKLPGRFRFAGTAAFAIVYGAWLFYGLPQYSAAPGITRAFLVAGLAGLLYSCAQAARGELWRWPAAANRDQGASNRDAGPPRQIWVTGPRYGVSAILRPLLQHAAVVTLIATGGIVFLGRILPDAGNVLFWSYFIGISTAGFVLTYQVRAATQCLRVLPLSTRRLALMLQFFGALPGIATLGLSLLVNGTLLHVKLNPAQFFAIALIIIAAQALPIAPVVRGIGTRAGKWSRLFQRLCFPVYIGFVLLPSGVWARWWWVRWCLMGAGLALCVVGYHLFKLYLRAGVRPSSNEEIFSAR